MDSRKIYTEQYLAESDLSDEGFTRQRSKQHGNPEFWLSENGHVVAWVCQNAHGYFVKYIGEAS